MNTIPDLVRAGLLVAVLLLIRPAFAGASVPAETTLRAPAHTTIKLGKTTGSMVIPAGRTVSVMQVQGDRIRIGLGPAQGWIPVADTDFLQRLAAADAAPTPVANVAPAEPPPAQITVAPIVAAEPAAPAAPPMQSAAPGQGKLDGYVSPLDSGPYNRNRSVVDHYDEFGRRYNIGVFGQRIYN